ncbi:MAG: HD domain-containing phosphohydrolase [Gaiellales bacterium]
MDLNPADAPASKLSSKRFSLLGLPGRLAGFTLIAIMLFTAVMTVYTSRNMQSTAEERVAVDGMERARSLALQLGESDFVRIETSKDADAKSASPDDALLLGQPVIKDQLELLAKSDEALQGVAIFTRAGGREAGQVAATKGTQTAPLKQLAKAVIAAGEQRSEIVTSDKGDHVLVAWPVIFGDGNLGGVVAAQVDAGNVLTAARQAQLRLVFGAIIGASLLAITLLLLLRRELFRPLEELRRVMSQIRSGATGVRIGWDRSDELGLVAEGFDSMVAELEATQEELARFINRDPLTGLLTAAAFTDRFSGELTRARREGYPISLLAIDVDDLAELNRTHDEAAGDQVLAAIGEVISGCTRPTDASGRTGGDSFHIALIGADAAQAAVVIQRIRSELAQQVGVGPERTRVTCGYGVAEYPSHSVDQIALERMAMAACMRAQRAGRDNALAFGPAGGYVDALSLVPDAERIDDAPAGVRELASTVHALARSLDGIDPALGGGAHSQRVARYAVAVAHELQFSDAQLRELRSAAVLHDIGKVAVPPSILRMPEEELDDRQRGALRYHAWVSRTMIAGAGLSGVADVVFHMPERWDGTGYPERAREEAIPLASRVLHAAELLDQLTTEWPGRPAMTPAAAASELKRRAGSELDPDIAVRLSRLVREEGLCSLDGSLSMLADAA